MAPLEERVKFTDDGLALRFTHGATLVELVVVIALLAIISAVAAIAVREPMQSYASSSRRASLTDTADTALRRMARDVRLALPNSARVTGAGPIYLELLQVKTGGRYRISDGPAGANRLKFEDQDTDFNMLGAPSDVPGQAIVANDILVIRNESASATRSNAYTYGQLAHNCTSTSPKSASCNTAKLLSAPVPVPGLPGESLIGFEARLFNYDTVADQGFPSPGNRFYVLSSRPAVTYACAPNAALDSNGDASGTLTRISNYDIRFAQPGLADLAAATHDVLARHLSACEISYDQNAFGNNGLVALRLALTRGNETIGLYHEVHVSNAP